MKYFIFLFLLFSSLCLAYKLNDKVEISTLPECPACQEAKDLLKKNNIPFKEIQPNSKYSEYVPQLFVNGKYLGSGTDIIEIYINLK